jgi:hypothetical protein
MVDSFGANVQTEQKSTVWYHTIPTPSPVIKGSGNTGKTDYQLKDITGR